VPVEHYENFPVASLLLPARVRPPIQAIYAFARSADDIADEGDADVPTRLAALSVFEAKLAAIAAGQPATDRMFRELATHIRAFNLPLSLLADLLDAFKQDVTKTEYASFAELLEYCRRSANPIGRLLLHLFNIHDERSLLRSDLICTSLQLINHWQDIAIDWQKNGGGRVYLPQDELHQFGLSNQSIAERRVSEAWSNLIAFQVQRARAMMLEGAPLAHDTPGRFGAELRLIVAGGLTILDKIDAVRGDIFNQRPTLSGWDWLRIGPPAILKLR
jgi:squalene synthase HpnC